MCIVRNDEMVCQKRPQICGMGVKALIVLCVGGILISGKEMGYPVEIPNATMEKEQSSSLRGYPSEMQNAQGRNRGRRQTPPQYTSLEFDTPVKVRLTASYDVQLYKFISMDKVGESSAIKVLLNSTDPYCTMVSVQNITIQSPMVNENNIRHGGYWHTMTTNGAITIPKIKYPKGFYLILRHLPDPNDDLCFSGGNPVTTINHKIVEVVIKRSVTDNEFLVGWLIPLVIYVILIIQSTLLTLLTRRCCGDKIEAKKHDLVPATETNEMQMEVSTKENGCCRRLLSKMLPPNFVTLDQTCTKSFHLLKRKSGVYVLSVLPVAIYYFLPAIQLVYMYLYTSHDSGNLDMCYYNFRCAYPLGIIHDFNHVYSNLGYLAAGIAAACWLRGYESMNHSKRREGYGIPSHAGLSYALAIATFCEGLLSGCYHVCPNQSNFHHDTCFMYVAVTLTALKLYQARHPDANMGAPTAFCLLGVVMLADLGGELIEHIAYYAVFSIFQVIALVLLTTQMYFLGRRPFWSKQIFTNILAMLRGDRSTHSDTTPVASNDMVHLFYAALVLNFAIISLGALVCVSAHNNNKSFDFGSHLLLVLGGNMGIYLLYYLAMKWIHGEEFSVFSSIQLGLSLVLWGTGVYFFSQVQSSWEETPAQSRTLNEECTFYDPHDLWHMFSAFALYTTLLGLESLDIKLLNKRHDEIAVF